MSNSIAPGSSADVNVKVTALTTNPNVPAQYKTVILKKNLVNGVNTLTQAMMNQTNTKYVIKYDYTLGENITVPAGCTLKFDGGSIIGDGTNKNTITGANTRIVASLVKIFNTNVTITGSWNVTEAYSEWFGAVGDGITDDTDAINCCLLIFNTTILLRKTYLVNTVNSNGIALNLPYGHNLIGQDNKRYVVGGADISIKTTNVNCTKILQLNGSNNLKNLLIQGCNSRAENPDLNHCGIGGPSTGYITKLLIEQVQVTECEVGFSLQCYLSTFISTDAIYCGIGFFLHGSLNSSLIPTAKTTTIFMKNCQAISCRRNGFYFIGVDYSTFVNLAADGSGRAWDGITNANSYYPYHFEYCVRSTFISLGSETVYKTIRTSVCHDLIFDGIFSILGYNSSAETTNHADEAPTYIVYNHHCYNVHYKNIVIQTNSSIQNLIQDSSDCAAVVIEGSATDKIAAILDGVRVGSNSESLVRAGNIIFTGQISEDNVIINYTLQKSNYYPEYPYITDYLRDTVKIKYNEAKEINLILSTNGYWGGPSDKIVDLKGKHLTIAKSDEDGYAKIEQNGGDRTWGFSNGKVTFKHINITIAAGSSSYVTNLKFTDCEVEFIDCIFVVTAGTMGTNQKFLIDTDKTIHFRNCRFITAGMPLVNYNFVDSVNDDFPVYSSGFGTLKGTKFTVDGITYIAQSDGQAMFNNVERYVNALPTISSNYEIYFEGCLFYYNGNLYLRKNNSYTNITNL